MPRSRQKLEAFDMLERFADDLASQSNPAKGNINRFEPLQQQEAFLRSQARNRILFGGNRGGKTHGGVADDVLLMMGKHPHRQHFYGDGPVRMRFIGSDFPVVEEAALPKFAQFLPPSALINGSWEDSYRKASRKLTLANKSTCSFMSYEQDPDKFQSVSLHHVHFDEEPPKAIFKESLMRLVDTGGTWSLSETPVQQLEWVEDELMAFAKEPVGDGSQDIEVFYLNTLDNKHLSSEALAEVIGSMTAEEQIVRLSGQYRPGSKVFPEFTGRYPFVIPQHAFWLTRDWNVYVGMDYGFVHPTAWVWIAAHRDGSIVVFDMLYSPGVVVSEWAKLVKQKNREIRERFDLGPDWAPRAYIGDPSISNRNASAGVTGTTIQQEYAKAGIAIGVEGIASARVGNQNIGLDKIHTYLLLRGARHSATTGEQNEPWMQITENCRDLIRELRVARKPKQTLAMADLRAAPEGIRDKDNDAIDALKYPLVLLGDLRPMKEAPKEETWRERLPEELHAVTYPFDDEDGVYASSVSSESGWSVTTGSSYADLEQA